MSRPAAFCAFAVAMMCWAVPATAEVVIQAERAAIRTEGGPIERTLHLTRGENGELTVTLAAAQ